MNDRWHGRVSPRSEGRSENERSSDAESYRTEASRGSSTLSGLTVGIVDIDDGEGTRPAER